MTAPSPGHSFHILAQTNSTNMYAMERIHAGLAVDGEVILAHEQLAGRGQRGKSWQSAPGQNILMSLVLDCSKLAVSQSFRLSAAMALACHDFFENLAGPGWCIKWPNDIYWRDRKAGGILIENLLQGGSWKWTVVGIGVNINQTDFSQTEGRPVSLRQISGKEYDPEELARQLCQSIAERWQQLLSGNWSSILAAYNSALYGRGEVKKLKQANVVTPCLIKRVNEQGVLLAGENEEWQFEHGEVEWIFE